MGVSDDHGQLVLPAGLAALARREEAGPSAGEFERQLIARAKAEPGAFAAIYRAHYPGVVRYLYRRVGDEHAAEDLAAETFVKAMRSIGRYESRGLPLRSWLLRIATNEAHRSARRAGRREAIDADGLAQLPARPGRDEERARVVMAALLALPARWQDVLALHHLEGLAVEQVAAVLRCRPGTVKSRLSRARGALRRELERRRYTHE